MAAPLHQIGNIYGLQGLALLSCIENPFSTTSFHLITKPEARHYFLKSHGQEKNALMLNRELELTESLRASGCALIPRTIPILGGRLFCEVGGKRYSLHPFVHGDTPHNWLTDCCSEAQSFASGKALAAMHRAGRKLTASQSVLRQSRKMFLQELPAAWNLILSSLQKISIQDDGSLLLVENVLKEQEHLTLLLGKILDQEEKDGDSNNTIIHGDFHPGNVIFQEQVVSALVDFDYIGIGPAEYDLAYGSIMFAADWLQPGGRSNLPSLLEGYEAGGGEFDQSRLEQQLQLAAFILLIWLIKRLFFDVENNRILAGPAKQVLELLSSSAK